MDCKTNIRLKKRPPLFPKINPTNTSAWQKLQRQAVEQKATTIKSLFHVDEKRFDKFSINFDEILFDYSKNGITEETIELLLELANECKLAEATEAMFSGEKINETENRAVLHTALRDFSSTEILVDGKNIIPEIKEERERVKNLCEQIESEQWLGCTGKPIRYIVNIGIGGSDLGGAMVTEALKPFWQPNIQPFFISNVDGSNLYEVVQKVNFEETLFIVASKTFTTHETMTNAHSVRELFLKEFENEAFIKKHFIAITGNLEKAAEFGIAPENSYKVWDWVGGRFSLWGSVGITIALTIGYTNFEALLKGANNIDTHFRKTEFKTNIPVMMALISIWNINFLNAKAEAIFPYDHYLSKLKSYLQQCNMESNGKSVDRNGQAVDYQSGVTIWGETGIKGQHSFFQLLHQGTEVIPCDFILTVNSQRNMQEHHEILLSNALAQTEALMKGKTLEEVKAEMPSDPYHATNFKVFSGNRPTNTFLIKELTPYNLGSLIALYEHKTFIQGVLWNIYSFDQWGVELGKKLAPEKLEAIHNKTSIKDSDSSTNGLLNRIARWSNSLTEFDITSKPDSNLFEEVKQEIESHGLQIASFDYDRPWGGFFVIEETQAQKFANCYFNGYKVEKLRKAGKLSPKILLVKPGARLSWQYHHRRAETWRVTSGPVGIVRSANDTEGEVIVFQTGETIVLQQGERHRLIGLDNWGIVAEFWQHTDPTNPSDEEDIVRVQDDYARK